MSLAHGVQLQAGEVEIRGISVAGISTCIYLPQWRIAMDVAQGLPFALSATDYFITHAHQDHASGIPYVISQKAMTNQKPPRFHMPEVNVEPLTEIMKLWSKLEGFEYNYEFRGAKIAEDIPLNPSHFVRPFQTVHRVPSQGYTVFRKQKKLKPEFKDKNRTEILKAREEGQELNDHTEEPIFTFTGDTQIEFLDKTEWVKNSKVLMLEVTYIDDKRTVAQAREWGHTHLDEVIPRLHTIKAEHIVLAHLSARHTQKEIEEVLAKKLPPEERKRIRVLR